MFLVLFLSLPSMAYIADGDYYLRNVGSDKYLTGANSWGTKASLGEYGIRVTLKRLSNGRYTIDTHFTAADPAYHYLNSDGYLDAEKTEWIITEISGGNYALTLDGSHYWGYNGNSNVVDNTLTDITHPNAQWQLVTREQLESTLSSATMSHGVDATFYIKGHSFNRNHNENTAWMGGPQLGGLESNLCAEKYNTTKTDVYQILTGLPNGYYILEVQGFYRDSYDSKTTAEHRDLGTEELRASLYAGDRSTPLKSILDDATSSPLDESAQTRYGWVPNSMIQAGTYFDEGLYVNKVSAWVTDGTLRIGISKSTGEYGDWIIFDNFRLTYYGTLKESEQIITFADNKVKDICIANWDITGDGELNIFEASLVETLNGVFVENKDITSFNELKYFTGLDFLNGDFKECKSLKSISLPNSVRSIGASVFDRCESLTSVTIPNSVTSIGDWGFHGCSGLTSVTIPNSVTSIGEGAFWGCSGLTSVTIPNSVTSIGLEVFAACYSLTSIVVAEGNPVYDSRNYCNAIIETVTNTLHSGCKTTIIPNSVTSIGDCAFYGCSSLTSITIPNSVTSISTGAFAYCNNLFDVYCNAEKVPSTNSDAFYESYIESITLHVPKSSVESYRTTEPWSGFGRIVALGEKEPGPCDLIGLWTMTTASGDVWNVAVRAASKDDPDYNNVLYLYGMMGYNWTKLKMHYSYNYDEGKPEIYVKAGELFAEGVNLYGNGVCDVYLYNLVSNYLTTADFTATVSTEGNTMTIDFGESEFYGAVYTGANYIGGWFRKTGVKMTRVIPNEESGETDIVNVEADPVIVQANGGVLSVSGVTEGTRVAIYTLSGTMVGSTTATNGTATINTSLPSGTIVIVRFGNKSMKVRI